MKLHFLLCSEVAARTMEGRYVLHGVLETLFTKEKISAEAPLTLPTLAVSFEIRDADVSKSSSVRLTMRLVGKEEPIFDHTIPVEPTNDPQKKMGGLFNFHLLPLKEEGEYRVDLAVDNQALGSTSFFVKQRA
jgi:hypothetical protein